MKNVSAAVVVEGRPGWTRPWVRAIAKASVNRVVRTWLASCQPVTIRLPKSMTVARYGEPVLGHQAGLAVDRALRIVRLGALPAISTWSAGGGGARHGNATAGSADIVRLSE
jgi:hypothetical protein